MKPNNTLLNTDFYQLANDGSLEVNLNIASGTVADFWSGAIFASKTFSVGSPLADYDGLIFDNKSGSWSAGTSKDITANVELVVDGISYGTFPMTLEIRFLRNSGNQFTLTVAATGLGGTGPDRPSILLYLRENVQVKLKIKTFLQPEL